VRDVLDYHAAAPERLFVAVMGPATCASTFLVGGGITAAYVTPV
jgi:hypothetical protein